MRTVAIVSTKGGVGKTTLAVNLAVAAHQRGFQVVIADLDGQASATAWGEARGDINPPVVQVHPPQLPRVRDELERQKCDLLMVDTPPHADAPAVAAAEIADLILTPVRPSIVDVRAIHSTLRIAKLVGKAPRAVITQTTARDLDAADAREVLTGLGFDVLPTVIVRRVAYSRSMIGGQSTAEFEPGGRGAHEIEELAEHVLKLVGLRKRRK